MKNTVPTTGLLSIFVLFTLTAIAGVDDDEASLARVIIQKSGITAQAAIERALKEFPGVVYEYELEEEDDKFVHEVELIDLENNKKHEVKVDAFTGEIVSASTHRGSSWFKEDEAMDSAKTIAKHEFPLLNALTMLPKGDGVLVAEVKFKHKQGVSFFELEFFGENGEEKILVDIASQSVIPRFKK